MPPAEHITSMSTEPLRRWGKPGDGQGARLAIVLVLLVIVLLGAWIFSLPVEGMGRCRSEDELRVRVLTESNDSPVPAGQTACVHIDAVRKVP